MFWEKGRYGEVVRQVCTNKVKGGVTITANFKEGGVDLQKIRVGTKSRLDDTKNIAKKQKKQQQTKVKSRKSVH